MRGLCKRCPRCGVERFVRGFFRVRPHCPHCGLVFEKEIGEHAGVMYLTTAVQTAGFAFIVLMVNPPEPWLARGILIAVAVGVMYLNLPNRKGLAIALDYLTRRGEERG